MRITFVVQSLWCLVKAGVVLSFGWTKSVEFNVGGMDLCMKRREPALRPCAAIPYMLRSFTLKACGRELRSPAARGLWLIDLLAVRMADESF